MTEDNALTGPIPTQIGNMRGLLELNLREYIQRAVKAKVHYI